MNEDVMIERLKEKIKKLGKVIVAFSGGVDSTFLLRICIDALGVDNVIAVTADSEIHPRWEIEEAKKIAKMFGVEHVILNIPFNVQNTRERCYFCKLNLYSEIWKIARERGIKYILEGSNMDDLRDYRPGRRAGKEMNILSPLEEFSKEEIRIMSKKLGLPTWNKASQSCLATRFPYGHEITRKELEMVANSEKFLRELGFKNVRVRHHGKLARIEVEEEDIRKIIELRHPILKKLRKEGYSWICIDLEGYRSGGGF